ncbi:MAG: BatD family protein [Kaistella sp.]
MKNRIPYILFLFSALLSYGQVTLAVSKVKDQKVNQPFNINVLLEIAGENMEQETPLLLPDTSKFEIIGTASEQNTVVLDPKKGNVLNQLVYQLVLSPKQAGKFKFGSVLVTVNGKIYKTEPFEITVMENDKKSSVAANSFADELYLNMEIEDRVVYKNEPTIAVLRAYSRDYDDFRKVGNIQYPQHKNIRIKPVSFAKSEIESHSGLASQVIAVFMIFPSETGKIDVPAVSASLAGTSKAGKISSNKVRLNVKKLPAGMPSHYKNAVGNFNIAVVNNSPAEVAEVEKPVTISVQISGSGNFGSLHLPRMVNSADYVFFAPKISTQTSAKRDGLTGNLVAEYVVIPKKAGPVTISFENFSFFNPDEKKYVDLGSKSIVLNVQTAEQIADAKSTIEKVNDYTNNVLETVNTPVLQTHNLRVKDKNSINWKIVFGNLALMAGFLSLFLIVQKKIKHRKLKPAHVAKPIVTIAETEEIIRKQLNVQFDDNINYLKKLAENKDYSNLLSAYDELNADTKNIIGVSTESDFKKYLEKNKGQQFAEDYRELSEQIKIEKYAPFHTDEHIDELLKAIIRIYSSIRQ